MISFTMVFFSIIAVIEVYYWFFWLPKNWTTVKECRTFVNVAGDLYGKDGKVWEQMEKGKL